MEHQTGWRKVVKSEQGCEAGLWRQAWWGLRGAAHQLGDGGQVS